MIKRQTIPLKIEEIIYGWVKNNGERMKEIEKIVKDYKPKIMRKNFVQMKNNEIEEYLENIADYLEPITHCCECTEGEHYQRHMIHIQYPKCNCEPKKYVLNKNYYINEK